MTDDTSGGANNGNATTTTVSSVDSCKLSKKEHLKRMLRSVTGLVRVNSYRQQKLPAWRPLLTNKSVVATLVLTATSLVVIGAGFLYVSSQVQVFEIDYTHCMPLYGSRTCAQILSDWQDRFNSSWPPPECTCWYKFQLEDDFASDVYVYYALSNFYQNHLHYVRSKDLSQFSGENSDSTDCAPFRTKPVLVNGKRVVKPIVPCGTIANSFFNDSFAFWLVKPNTSWPNSITQVPLLQTGIAWQSDSTRYRNPSDKSVFASFTNPPYWGNKTIWDLDPENADNNGLRNEALIVWMRVAAFPDFWKLYARVNHAISSFAQLIPSGQYYLKINYNYPVADFKGHKSFILANTNKGLGGSYFFLAIVYLVVGGLCAISAFVLATIHAKFGVSKEEYMDINETTPYFFNRNGKQKKLTKKR